MGDFVIAIFNPQSLERNWQLKRTIKLCLGYRPGNTPVLVGRQVGREDQSLNFFNLDSVPLKDIDMLSIIIIGNSKTTLVDEIFLTPRGYLWSQKINQNNQEQIFLFLLFLLENISL